MSADPAVAQAAITPIALTMAPVLVRVRDAARICGVSVPAFRRLVRQGLAPRPVRLGKGIVAWRPADLAAWAASLKPS